MSNSKEVIKKYTAVCVWDFTLFDDISAQEIQIFLKSYCKKWAFQKEKGLKTGKVHWQGRFSLKVRTYKEPLVRILSLCWKKFHVSITSLASRDNMLYVMKKDTRILGPYTNKDFIAMPRDLLKIKDLYPWQLTLKDMMIVPDDRIIDVVIDKLGNVGKSIFSKWMYFNEKAAILPYCNDFKDLMQAARCIVNTKGELRTWIIDMPKAIAKEKLKGFYSGIESLKNGYVYDTRYKFDDIFIDPPRVIVFTNEFPEKDYLSEDRWRLWKIDNLKLKSINFEDNHKNNDYGINNNKLNIISQNLSNELEFFSDEDIEDDMGKQVLINKHKLKNDPVYCRRLLHKIK